MKAELKKKWVEALRSFKYERGTGYLRTGDNKFCCLGVLADVARPEGWSDQAVVAHKPDTEVKTYYLYDGVEGAFGNDTLVEFGLGAWAQADLIDLNDREGATFAEIADWIEAELETEDDE